MIVITRAGQTTDADPSGRDVRNNEWLFTRPRLCRNTRLAVCGSWTLARTVPTGAHPKGHTPRLAGIFSNELDSPALAYRCVLFVRGDIDTLIPSNRLSNRASMCVVT